MIMKPQQPTCVRTNERSASTFSIYCSNERVGRWAPLLPAFYMQLTSSHTSEGPSPTHPRPPQRAECLSWTVTGCGGGGRGAESNVSSERACQSRPRPTDPHAHPPIHR